MPTASTSGAPGGPTAAGQGAGTGGHPAGPIALASLAGPLGRPTLDALPVVSPGSGPSATVAAGGSGSGVGQAIGGRDPGRSTFPAGADPFVFRVRAAAVDPAIDPTAPRPPIVADAGEPAILIDAILASAVLGNDQVPARSPDRLPTAAVDAVLASAVDTAEEDPAAADASDSGPFVRAMGVGLVVSWTAKQWSRRRSAAGRDRGRRSRSRSRPVGSPAPGRPEPSSSLPRGPHALIGSVVRA